ncbi:hypothetical protein [Rubrivirga marina]|uniref:XRE family transcriptional regulator n=1 Tax=Rubrivirga marina TaxID=1196024 RepID=A0A271IVL9_9BACT|nr:hypothetical protein [Rubrivirga marina]PAP75296.1 hypothetical protein BSZ37_01980 [Rubrivirga marina]
MTAREFSDLFKPYLPVRTVAKAAGFKESTWYTTTTRGRELTPDEVKRLRGAVEAHAAEIARLAGGLG